MKIRFKTLFLIFLAIFTFNPFNLKAINQSLAQKGEIYINSLYGRNNQIIPTEGENYLDSMFAIMTYICSKIPAKNSGQYFSSGSVVLEDEDWKLYKFLLDYVKREYKGDICKEIISSKYKAYPRKSTHLNSYYLYTNKMTKKGFSYKKNCDYTHYGIDLKKDQLLPIEKKHHILFGKIGEKDGIKLLFIKFEEAGLQEKDAFNHFINLLKTKIKEYSEKINTKKQKVQLPTESELKEQLNKLISVISADDSLTKYRRESIPLEYIGEYVELILSKESGIDKKMQHELKKRVKALGIQDIAKTAELLSKSHNGTPAWREAMSKLAQEVKQKYPNDFNLRIGNEIILLQKDFVEPAQLQANV